MGISIVNRPEATEQLLPGEQKGLEAMNDEKATQRDTQAKPQAEPQGQAPVVAAKPSASVSVQDGGWLRASPSQVMRTVAIALLTAAVMLGALFLLWQVRTFIGWFVVALFLAAALDPLVNWLQRRHRLIKRPLAIALSYLGVLVALLYIAGIFLPLLVDQINGLTRLDRKSTRLNSSHANISYAVFCLKKKKT